MSRKERHAGGGQERPATKRLADLVSVAKASLQGNWLPDVFASVFDVVSFHGQGMRFSEAHVEHANELGIFIRRRLEELRRAQDDQLGSIPESLRSFLAQALERCTSEVDEYAGVELIFALHLIDTAFWGLGPAADGSDDWGYLALYRAMLWEGTSLLKAVPGYLLPRVGRAARPARTECDFFSNLCRVRAQDSCEVEYLLFDELNPAGAGISSGRRSMRVGVLAAVQHHDELSWTIDAKKRLYTVSLKATAEANILQRTLAGLEWLADNGAEIVLIPELVSSDTLDQNIREWLKNREGPKPRLIVTGTYMKRASKSSRRHRNRAHVIDCTGSELWCQDKLHPYTFTLDHQRDGKWTLGGGTELVEDIDVSGRKLFIADSPLGERIAVLICEDFARAAPQKQLLVELGVNVILVPVMNPARPDPATNRSDWIKRYALDYASEPRALSLVGNSGALLFPPGRERSEYDYVCAIDTYRTKTYDTAKYFPKPAIDAVLITVEL